MTIRAIIYARVSYDDRDTDGRNLAGQLEMGRAHCQKKGYTIVSELAEDSRGASGAEINLPQLNKALEMARAGLFDVLIVRELDRLSRDVAKLYIVTKELKHHGAIVEYVLNDFPDTPTGQLMKNIYASFAQFEREEIRLRMMRGKRNKVNAGNVMLDRAPYGYRLQREPVGHDEYNFSLKPYAPEVTVIRQIYTWYARGYLPIREIVRRLDSEQAPAPESGGRKRAGGWPRSTIFKILRTRTYIGEWEYTYDNTEKLTVNVSPIIDPDLWQAAQAILDEGRDKMIRAARYEYLFGRRLTCGKCGRFMVVEPQHRNDRLYLYYVCAGEEHNRLNHCPGMRIRADLIDHIAWEWLAGILEDPEKLKSELDLFQSMAARQNAPALEQIKITDELIGENKSKLARLVELYISGTFPLEDLQERKNRLENTIKSLEDQKSNLLASLEGQALTPEQIDELQAFAGAIRGRLATASHYEKLQLFRLLNVTGMLTEEEEGKVFHVQCILRPESDNYLLTPSQGNHLALVYQCRPCVLADSV